MLYCSLNINKDKNVHRFEPRGRKDNEREKGGEGKEREREVNKQKVYYFENHATF